MVTQPAANQPAAAGLADPGQSQCRERSPNRDQRFDPPGSQPHLRRGRVGRQDRVDRNRRADRRGRSSRVGETKPRDSIPSGPNPYTVHFHGQHGDKTCNLGDSGCGAGGTDALGPDGQRVHVGANGDLRLSDPSEPGFGDDQLEGNLANVGAHGLSLSRDDTGRGAFGVRGNSTIHDGVSGSQATYPGGDYGQSAENHGALASPSGAAFTTTHSGGMIGVLSNPDIGKGTRTDHWALGDGPGVVAGRSGDLAPIDNATVMGRGTVTLAEGLTMTNDDYGHSPDVDPTTGLAYSLRIGTPDAHGMGGTLQCTGYCGVSKGPKKLAQIPAFGTLHEDLATGTGPHPLGDSWLTQDGTATDKAYPGDKALLTDPAGTASDQTCQGTCEIGMINGADGVTSCHSGTGCAGKNAAGQTKGCTASGTGCDTVLSAEGGACSVGGSACAGTAAPRTWYGDDHDGGMRRLLDQAFRQGAGGGPDGQTDQQSLRSFDTVGDGRVPGQDESRLGRLDTLGAFNRMDAAADHNVHGMQQLAPAVTAALGKFDRHENLTQADVNAINQFALLGRRVGVDQPVLTQALADRGPDSNPKSALVMLHDPGLQGLLTQAKAAAPNATAPDAPAGAGNSHSLHQADGEAARAHTGQQPIQNAARIAEQSLIGRQHGVDQRREQDIENGDDPDHDTSVKADQDSINTEQQKISKAMGQPGAVQPGPGQPGQPGDGQPGGAQPGQPGEQSVRAADQGIADRSGDPSWATGLDSMNQLQNYANQVSGRLAKSGNPVDQNRATAAAGIGQLAGIGYNATARDQGYRSATNGWSNLQLPSTGSPDAARAMTAAQHYDRPGAAGQYGKFVDGWGASVGGATRDDKIAELAAEGTPEQLNARVVDHAPTGPISHTVLDSIHGLLPQGDSIPSYASDGHPGGAVAADPGEVRISQRDVLVSTGTGTSQWTPLYTVRMPNGTTQLIDPIGERWASFAQFQQRNDWLSPNSTITAVTDLNAGPGNATPVTMAGRSTSPTTEQWISRSAGYLTTAGLGSAAVGFEPGLVAAAGGGAVGGWMDALTLQERREHNQTLDPSKSTDARDAEMGVATTALAFGSGGLLKISSGFAGQALGGVLEGSALTSGGYGLYDSATQTAGQWNQMSTGNKVWSGADLLSGAGSLIAGPFAGAKLSAREQTTVPEQTPTSTAVAGVGEPATGGVSGDVAPREPALVDPPPDGVSAPPAAGVPDRWAGGPDPVPAGADPAAGDPRTPASPADDPDTGPGAPQAATSDQQTSDSELNPQEQRNGTQDSQTPPGETPPALEKKPLTDPQEQPAPGGDDTQDPQPVEGGDDARGSAPGEDVAQKPEGGLARDLIGQRAPTLRAGTGAGQGRPGQGRAGQNAGDTGGVTGLGSRVRGAIRDLTSSGRGGPTGGTPAGDGGDRGATTHTSGTHNHSAHNHSTHNHGIQNRGTRVGQAPTRSDSGSFESQSAGHAPQSFTGEPGEAGAPSPVAPVQVAPVQVAPLNSEAPAAGTSGPATGALTDPTPGTQQNGTDPRTTPRNGSGKNGSGSGNRVPGGSDPARTPARRGGNETDDAEGTRAEDDTPTSGGGAGSGLVGAAGSTPQTPAITPTEAANSTVGGHPLPKDPALGTASGIPPPPADPTLSNEFPANTRRSVHTTPDRTAPADMAVTADPASRTHVDARPVSSPDESDHQTLPDSSEHTADEHADAAPATAPEAAPVIGERAPASEGPASDDDRLVPSTGSSAVDSSRSAEEDTTSAAAAAEREVHVEQPSPEAMSAPERLPQNTNKLRGYHDGDFAADYTALEKRVRAGATRKQVTDEAHALVAESWRRETGHDPNTAIPDSDMR